jgi:predicted GTPase
MLHCVSKDVIPKHILSLQAVKVLQDLQSNSNKQQKSGTKEFEKWVYRTLSCVLKMGNIIDSIARTIPKNNDIIGQTAWPK